MPANTFVRELARRSPAWMVGTPENGQLAERFWGVVLGLTGDLFAEAMRLALRMPWLLDPESPDDVLCRGFELELAAPEWGSPSLWGSSVWGDHLFIRF